MVGSGGMAHVHLAIQNGPQGYKKPCVLKRIAPEHVSSRAFRKMFLEEARLTALLSHPAIVQTFDFGEVDNIPYLALELVDGPNLARLCVTLAKNMTWIPIRAAVELTARVADALDYAHNLVSLDGLPMNLVHRDVSPQNIMLSRTGEVKLGDFGIARHDHRENVTLMVEPKGKPGYMAPEQALGRLVDARADVFALGVVLVEMVSARRLLGGGLPIDLSPLKNKVNGLLVQHPQCPERLRALLLAMTAVEPAERPGSMREIAQERRAIAETLPGRTLPTVVTETLAKHFPRAASASSGGSLGTGSSGGGGASWVSLPVAAKSQPKAPVEYPDESVPTTLGRESEEEWLRSTEVDPTSVQGASAAYEALLRDTSFRLELESVSLPPTGVPQAAGWGEIQPDPTQLLSQEEKLATIDRNALHTHVHWEHKDRGIAVEGPERTAVPVADLSLDPPVLPGVPDLPLPQRTKRPPPIPWVFVGVGLVVVVLLALGVRWFNRAPPPPPMMILDVSSSPDGARIMLDGLDSGKVTPALIEVPPQGAIRVNATKKGYVSTLSDDVVVVAEAGRRVPLQFSLLPARVLRLVSEPSGAKVSLNDRQLPASTPLELPPLVLGSSATISLTLSGYVPRRVVLLSAAETATVVSVELAEGEEFSISTQPPGAAIFIDNDPVGSAPLESVLVPKGRPFVVKAVHPAYKTEVRRVTRRPTTGALELVLSEKPLQGLPMSKEERRDAARIQDNLTRLRFQLADAKRNLAQKQEHLRKIESTRQANVVPFARAQAAFEEAQSRVEQLEQRLDEAEGALEEIRSRAMSRAAGELP